MRKKCTPLLSDMAIQMEPITIMVRLKRAKTAAARFRSVNKSRMKINNCSCFPSLMQKHALYKKHLAESTLQFYFT